MAPVLQCPDCDTKHPLNEVPDRGTFACKGCGRALKVPEVVPRAAAARAAAPPLAPAAAATAAATVAGAPVAAPQPTRVMPVVTRNEPIPPSHAPPPAGRSARAAGGRARVPWWMQLLLWIVAVPVAFVIVFLVARASGTFTSDQLYDVFLASGIDRFWPLARLLPFVALLTAGLVQGGVLLLSRRPTRQGAGTR